MQGRGTYGKRRWLTIGSLAALVLGFALGTWAHSTGNPVLLGASALMDPFGTVWVNALRMVVLPLVASQLVYTLVMAGGAGAVGRITSSSFLVFGALLITSALLTIAIAPVVLDRLEFSPAALAALRAVAPPAVLPPAVAARGPADWVNGLVPSNVFRAASQDDLLGLMIFAIAFGLAVGRMPAARRAPVSELFQTIAEAMMAIVGWIIWLMPVAVFSLSFATSARAGLGAVDVMVTFLILMCSALLILTLLQYVIVALFGSVSMRRFASAALPVQLVALSTRSSIACLPLLLDRARNHLGVRAEVSTVVMPLAVSTFKINKGLSSPLQFLFLAHVYGIDLSLAQVLAFTTIAILLSFTTVGIPSGGSVMRSAPLYVAAGIPIQGYLLAEAVESIPDLFKTLVNVTGNMTAAALVNRWTATPSAVAASAPASSEIAAGV